MQFKERGSELRRRRGKKVVKRITAESVCWVRNCHKKNINTWKISKKMWMRRILWMSYSSASGIDGFRFPIIKIIIRWKLEEFLVIGTSPSWCRLRQNLLLAPCIIVTVISTTGRRFHTHILSVVSSSPFDSSFVHFVTTLHVLPKIVNAVKCLPAELTSQPTLILVTELMGMEEI